MLKLYQTMKISKTQNKNNITYNGLHIGNRFNVANMLLCEGF